MRRFHDWLFECVYLPFVRKWARTRTAELVENDPAVYERLMREVDRVEQAVRDAVERRP